MKNYIAFYDDGHDFGEFPFTSEHRANSKANIEDAKKAAEKRYGYKRAKVLTIINTQLDDAE